MAGYREAGLSPRLRLLLETHHGRHRKLRTLAENLGISVQAVSESLRRLEAEGLAQQAEGIWKPTPRGTHYLQEAVTDVRRQLDEALERMSIIAEAVALAASPIRANQPVGLAMRRGHLWATPDGDQDSRGLAANDAGTGDLVRVRDLRGIVNLLTGRIDVLVHDAKPTVKQARKAATLHRRAAALVAVHETAGRALAATAGLDVAVEFAPTDAALDAARRGVDVLYLVPKAEVASVMARLAAARDAAGEPIAVTRHDT